MKNIDTKSINNLKKIAGPIFIATLVLVSFAAIMLIVNNKDRSEPNNNGRTLLPVPVPAEGDKYTDIATTDTAKQAEFIQAGAAYYNMNSSKREITPQTIANACAENAVAEINHAARVDEAYRNNHSQIDNDVKAVTENCYAKYSDTAYVEPEKPKSHSLNPDTFLPNTTH